MTGAWWVNGTDTGTLGVEFEDASGIKPGVRREQPTVPVPGSWVSAWLGRHGQPQPRQILVSATIRGADADAVSDNADTLAALIGLGDAELIFGLRLDRYYTGRLVNPEALSIAPVLTQRAHRVRLQFTCADPRALSTSDTVLIFPSFAVAAPIGTAPSLPLIELTAGAGGLVNPVVRYRDAGGTIVQTLGVLTTIADGDTLSIDCAQKTMLLQDGTNMMPYLDGETDFLVLDEPGGTLEIDPPGVATLARATYRRAWE